MADGKRGGRPQGSKNKRRASAQIRLSQRKNKPCPDLAKAGHGEDCPTCGGTGEVRG